ncbi:Translin-associated protein X [Daldinia childiae]|uniref:Translin-associated protein X n=2 Tax=Daldinia childiae TaxID=326645 RepID=UPI001446424C|nr:Translin-associated protein X [Daldinia childiae]KAF3069843.1 Translin-associated protein X [Daldinia childiae]
MSEVIVPQNQSRAMGGGIKRDYQGKEKVIDSKATKDMPRNQYTSMFESFRDELDEHHDRRMKIGKVSRDVTALSKKIIFSLQRVRKLNQPLPPRIQADVDERLKEIAGHLTTIESDVIGMNRYRYPLICLEEFVEAISFSHYLQHQKLLSPSQAQDALPADIALTAPDYLFGIFDLTGEMMRFATAITALSGSMPGSGTKGSDDGRTILNDLQDVSSMLQICPPAGGKPSVYAKKLDIMIEQVRKVERVGYGITVRGNERPKGWMPDMNESGGFERDREDVSMD